MKKSYLIFFSILHCLCSQPLYAQQTFNGTWDGITLFSDQTKPVFYYVKTEGRFYLNQYTRNELLIRPALGYTVNKRLSLWLGYDMNQTLSDSAKIRQTIWQQSQLKMIETPAIDLLARTRVEERFPAVNPGIAYRLRERAAITFKQLNKSLYPLIYDEVFVNVNHPAWVSIKTLSQNRVFLGAKIPVNGQVAIIVGYLDSSHYNTGTTVREHLLSTELEIQFG